MLNEQRIKDLDDELFNALVNRQMVDPLTDQMVYGNGDEMPISEKLIQPKAPRCR
ncbi:MAG: hypothetical protein KZQ81_04620 [Candidatus Thiodiazotropha sp. (ex Rostrolucina anterorostrata)]|nr:hypothetical protein [Candidatus Thiodiazotropha sp. (ex Rostrolucina anterorostrata)]